ncbi:MAG: ROK family protein, partial [Planctomycetota bacterium]
MKKLNRVRIVNHLRRFGPASRAELARTTGLDPKTITNCCNSLFDDKLIERREPVASGRGRPAERMAIRSDAALAVGIDIGAQQVTVLTLDLEGTVGRQARCIFGRSRRRDALLEAVNDQLDEVLSELSDSLRRNVVGLGVCAPGFLDRNTGVIVRSVNIRGFTEVPIARLLEERTELPVTLEESSRA